MNFRDPKIAKMWFDDRWYRRGYTLFLATIATILIIWAVY